MKPTMVVGIDFSPYGRKAFDSARALARDLKAKMVLVHAFPRHFIPAEVSPSTAERMEEIESRNDMQEAMRLTTEWAQEARKDGLEVATRTGQGSPANLVLEAAKELSAALIVVGTHGRTGLRRVLMGSVAEEIVRRSTVPVLVVPGP